MNVLEALITLMPKSLIEDMQKPAEVSVTRDPGLLIARVIEKLHPGNKTDQKKILNMLYGYVADILELVSPGVRA